MKTFLVFFCALMFVMFSEGSVLSQTTAGGSAMILKVESSAFKDGDMIPSKYACEGINVSPPLKWSGGPDGTKSFALIADDPDAPAGTWVHWIVYNIPPSVKNLAEHVPVSEKLKDGTLQGMNDFRKAGYGGPCPPMGTHRYYFKVYALDTMLSLGPGATKKQVADAMRGHILAEGQLMGRYKRN